MYIQNTIPGDQTGNNRGGLKMADLNDITKTKDFTSQMDPNDIQQNKVMGILAYLSWLVLIPLFAAKDSKFARFHCNQGIILAIVEIAAWIVFGILSLIPFVGLLFVILNIIVNIACFIFAILGIINAASGLAKELPLIGGIRIIK